MYEYMKKEGYNPEKSDKPPRLYIGRHGEYMRVDGAHRISMAKILGLESIPVQICLVHKQWQELRYDVYKNGFPDEYDEELRDHPDLQDVTDD